VDVLRWPLSRRIRTFTSGQGIFHESIPTSLTEEKTQFLADRSHDIRNHMNLILGFSQVLKTEIIDEEQKRNLEAILSSGRTLLKLINDLIDLNSL